MKKLFGFWEQRWHPLREEWVIVAAHRQDRPWNGANLIAADEGIPEYIEDCYLCPRNLRVSGKENPDYDSVFIFDNDHPCVGSDAPQEIPKPFGIYKNRASDGIARVICYSPKHNLTLAELELHEVEKLLTTWQKQYVDLAANPKINHVLIFENKGQAVGVSNPHPHCQIYATNFVSKIIESEAATCARYFKETGRILFQDIISSEKSDGRRIISENETAIAFLPYFARYAFEVFVAPKKTHQSLATLSDKEIVDFAEVLRDTLIRFDNLWQMSFPYVMSLHQAPTDGGNYETFQFHIEFHPPLRKPNLLKYLAGAEIGGGNFLTDTSPEEKASEMQAMSPIHYKNQIKF